MAARQAADGQRQWDVFDVDEDRALEALRLAWGDAYAVCFDDAVSAAVGRCQAWRLGGDGTMFAGNTPDELNAAIRSDWARGGTL